MAMPRKKARRIVVGGRAYIWRLRPPPDDPDDWMETPPRRMGSTMLLQADSKFPGRVCKLYVSWREDIPVTPEAVALIIRRCLAGGWDPDARGIPFHAPDVDVLELDTKAATVRAVMES